MNGIRGIFSYESAPRLEPITGTDSWRVVAPWKVEVKGEYFVIPAGFDTDGASIPRFLWRICGHPLTTTRMPVAIYHDAVYRGLFRNITRAYADANYRDGLVAMGWPKWKAAVEWAALRTFGWINWKGPDTMTEMIVKALIITAFIIALLVQFGCRSVTVDRVYKEPVVVDGKIATDDKGAPFLADKGWTVEYWMFGLSTEMESMVAEIGEIKLKLGRISSDISKENAKVVNSVGEAVGTVAEKVIEAAKH